MNYSKAFLPLEKYGSSEIYSFNDLPGWDGKDHFAIIFKREKNKLTVPIVRIHSECVTGDLFGSLRCDCGKQLQESMNLFSEIGGILIYLRQEGRGIGLHQKIAAYSLQELGLDTFQANLKLGYPEDNRSYEMASEILKALNIYKVRLLTRNPKKIEGICSSGIQVVEQIKTDVYINPNNESYIMAKENRTKDFYHS